MTIDEPVRLTNGDLGYLVRIDRLDMAHLRNAIVNAVVEQVAQKLAGEFLAEHGTEVLAKMSPDAIATMAIAEAAAGVHETLQRKLPDKILEIERRVETEPIVLQRGIFGGVRRLR